MRTASLVALAAIAIASVAPAEARDRHHRHRSHDGAAVGAALGAGIFLGALAASSANARDVYVEAAPPPPPPDIPELDEKKQLTGTLRQVMEQHRENPICASCHARMDPIGFAFENYDAIGAYRTKDGQFDVDPSGELPDGQKFQGPAELKAILKEKKELFARSLAEKILTYAVGRGLEYYDKCAVDEIVAALEKNDYRFGTLIAETVHSEPFQMRTATGEKQP